MLLRESQEVVLQLVLLTAHRETALKGCHDKIGHLDLERMLDLMCDHFFWSKMAVHAKEHTGKCCQCVIFKAKQQRVPMENIVVTHPLELVHIDYLCLKPGKWKEENILVVTNHFNQYMQVYIAWSQICPSSCQSVLGQCHYSLQFTGFDNPIRGKSFFKVS